MACLSGTTKSVKEVKTVKTAVHIPSAGIEKMEKPDDLAVPDELMVSVDTGGSMGKKWAESLSSDQSSESVRSEGFPSEMEIFQERIGYTFRRPEILRLALTHSSGATCREQSNERLEFLGDAILGDIICVELFRRFPKADEGELTRLKSDVVSRETCARVGCEIGLSKVLIVGRAISLLREMPASIPANAMEALIAAVAIDGGRRAVRCFIERYFRKEIVRAAADTGMTNAKSSLQQLSQQRFGCAPQYVLLDEQGPAHSRAFRIAVRIAIREFPSAWGASKKQTEQQAARNALEVLLHSDCESDDYDDGDDDYGCECGD